MRAVLVALLIANVATADEPPIMAAARRRQEALPSVELVLKVKSPNETSTLRLVFDGPKARFEQHVGGDGGRTWVATTDNQQVKVALLWNNPTRGESAGNIGPPGDGVCRGTQFLPLTLAARPLDPVHCPFPIDSLTPTGTEEIGGRVCDVFTGSLAGVPGTFWFDPAAGHSLRRFRHGGTVTDVESSNANPASVWLPTKYTVTKPGTNGRPEVVEYVVEQAEVGKQYPASEFDLLWPAGLKVYDLTSGGRAFVSDPDGVLHPADDQSMWQRAVSLWWVPVAFVGLTAGLIGWRMWKNRSRPLTPGPSPSRGEGN